MLSTSIKWFKALSNAGKAGIITASLLGFGVVSAATGNNQAAPQNPSDKTLTTQKADEITHKTVTTTETVPFITTNVDDSSLAKDTTRVTTEGVDGVKTRYFDVTYKNGTETSRIETSSTITKQPVTKVVSIGTHVTTQISCPNGTYVNTAGNTVCSPYSSSSAPAGATAQCTDGTYSFSQTRSGTCSHHGGVASWL